MAEQTEIEKYNYRDFVSSDFLPFRTDLPVGSSAPGCCPVSPRRAHRSFFLRTHRPLVDRPSLARRKWLLAAE